MSTNSLKYRTTRTKGDTRVDIVVRLDDECRNGHQDFAITGTLYERTERGWRDVGGGCIHDEILAVAPELKPFVKLHLSDYLGRPMYAAENGFYHLKKGFNNTPVDDPKFPAEFCDYYRITRKQFRNLKKCETVLQYRIALQALEIIDQWKVEADAAIRYLEALTEETFLVDSRRSQYTPPTLAEIEEETQRIESGYYTAPERRKREKAAADKIRQALLADLQAELDKAVLQFNVKNAVLQVGGPAALKACIFYTHTNTLTFNWSTLNTIPREQAEQIISKLRLPEGVKTEIAVPK